MVKDIAVAEVQYGSIKSSLRLGDISGQSKATTLDVDTSHLEIISYFASPLFPSYCPLSRATGRGAR